jgi:c-di-GMP-binding flagellar brake protein YcgR
MSDMRNYIRLDQHLPITITSHGRQFQGTTSDLSLGGMLVTCDQAASLGTLVNCRLEAKDKKKPSVIVIDGVIVRHDHLGMAVRFTKKIAIHHREQLCQVMLTGATNKALALAEISAFRKQLMRAHARA